MKYKILEILEEYDGHILTIITREKIAKKLSQLMNKPTPANLSTDEIREVLIDYAKTIYINSDDAEMLVDEYPASHPDSKAVTDDKESKDDSYNSSLCKCEHPILLQGVCEICGGFEN